MQLIGGNECKGIADFSLSLWLLTERIALSKDELGGLFCLFMYIPLCERGRLGIAV